METKMFPGFESTFLLGNLKTRGNLWRRDLRKLRGLFGGIEVSIRIRLLDCINKFGIFLASANYKFQDAFLVIPDRLSPFRFWLKDKEDTRNGNCLNVLRFDFTAK